MNKGMKKGIESDRRVRKSAMKLFLKKGFNATSMDEIASAAGLQKGSLYHYIASKNDLLFPLFDDAIDDVNTSLKTILKSDLPADKKLEKAIQNHIQKQIEHFDEYCLYLQERKFLPKSFETRYTKKRRVNETLFNKIIQEGIDEGIFRKDIDVRITTLSLFGMLNWMTQWFKPRGRLSAENLGELTYDLAIRGIGR
jgi:AcrR family transcriptional regulator